MLLVGAVFSLPFTLVVVALGFAEWSRRDWEQRHG